MKVLVLGAGVIGATTAYWLARDGHEVTVLDRQAGPGLETSFANGGQVSAGHAVPWAGPGTPLQVLKWLGRTDAPLLFHFRFDAAMWRWCFRFLRECTDTRARVNLQRTLRVADYSRRRLTAFRAESGIEYGARTAGILHFYRDAAALDQAHREAEIMRGHGLDLVALDVADMVRMEPAFAATADTLAGGLHCPTDESGDCYAFTAAIAKKAEALGVRFETGVTVRRLEAQGGRITAVETSKGRFSAERYVMSLGSYSPLLLAPVGIRLPVYPAKGYSVTLPLSAPGKAPTVSLTDAEKKLVYSRLGDTLRIAGTAELAGYDTTMNTPRARSILDAALEQFPECGIGADATLWTGLRPTTPDSVPVIGRTPLDNLLLNTGHGMLGWTMAVGSACIVADLIAGRTPEISLDGLGMERFR